MVQFQDWLKRTTNKHAQFCALTSDAQGTYIQDFLTDNSGTLHDMLQECLTQEKVSIQELGEKVKSAWEEYLAENLDVQNEDLKEPLT